MSWLESLIPASFDGVPFYVEAHDSTGGRRIAATTAPYREAPWVEDLGREPTAFNLSGFLVGDDYQVDRDRLRRALDSPPPNWPDEVAKVLDHPYLGRLRVVCRRYSVSESTREGRFVRFQMDFLEAPIAGGLEGQSPDLAAAAAGAAAASAAAGELEAGLVVEAAAQSVYESTESEIEGVAEALAETHSQLLGAQADVEAQKLATVTLFQLASTYATAPADLVVAVQSAADLIEAAAGSALGALYAYEALLGLEPRTTASGSLVEAQASTNAKLVTNLALVSALAGAARSAVAVEWNHVEQAEERRAVLLDSLATVQASGVGAELYARLEQLAAVVTESVPPSGQSLPHLEQFELPGPSTSIHVGYELYGDASREDEVRARNPARRHPGFLHGAPLEVLADA